ncbi:hypothetical protein G6045_37585 [Streptomyces sp. YC504]|uniref:Secreted protein n=1 Tax=Streptomyces mesophilus TaxID=1775132 RepID=A0A6G4XVX2_9ACTN|nr:hypothetical protein [Streptomyces mesophilus]NGO81332.1 hypothetical protein [Streptomyces mesophilus]
MGEVLAVLAVLFVLFVALGVFVTVKVVKAAKRGVDRTITQARRHVEDSTLKARTLAQIGPAGELAQLRLKLRTSMRATQDALQAAVAEDASLQESVGLFERLSVHGWELDADLKRLEREPDKARLGAQLPELKERTDRITEAADSLRFAAQDRARRFADDEFASLRAQIDVESGALRHWTREEPGAGGAAGASGAGSFGAGSFGASAGAGSSSGTGSSPRTGEQAGASVPSPASPTPASTPTPTPAPASWPEPTLIDGPAAPAEQTWPDRDLAGQGDAGPQAIEPPGPQVTYPWQKQARPEARPEGRG